MYQISFIWAKLLLLLMFCFWARYLGNVCSFTKNQGFIYEYRILHFERPSLCSKNLVKRHSSPFVHISHFIRPLFNVSFLYTFTAGLLMWYNGSWIFYTTRNVAMNRMLLHRMLLHHICSTCQDRLYLHKNSLDRVDNLWTWFLINIFSIFWFIVI